MATVTQTATTSNSISVAQAVDDIAAGRCVIIVDALDRENEGDLVCSGELVTAEMLNLFATEGRGLTCTPVSRQVAERVGLSYMVEPDENRAPFQTAFMVSVEARDGVTTGVSCPDRARTIRLLADESSGPSDFDQPGHVFPLQAVDGGVRVRQGHTEASIELCRRAGLAEVAVICEVMAADGTMARLPELTTLASRLGLGILTIEQLVAVPDEADAR